MSEALGAKELDGVFVAGALHERRDDLRALFPWPVFAAATEDGMRFVRLDRDGCWLRTIDVTRDVLRALRERVQAKRARATTLAKAKRNARVAQPKAFLRPTPERARLARLAGGGIERAQPERRRAGESAQILDAEGNPGSPWRVVDTLTAMHRAGTITDAQRSAGERFRDDYELAGLAGTAAARLLSTGRGDGSHAMQRRIEAGHQVDAAVRALGGRGPLVYLVRDVIGLGMSLRAWDERERCRRGTAARMLVEGLDILVDHYGLG